MCLLYFFYFLSYYLKRPKMRTKINVFILALLNDDLKIIGPTVRLFSDFLSYRPKKKLKCTLNGYKFILTRTKNEIVSKRMVKIGSLVRFFLFSLFFTRAIFWARLRQ